MLPHYDRKRQAGIEKKILLSKKEQVLVMKTVIYNDEKNRVRKRSCREEVKREGGCIVHLERR